MAATSSDNPGALVRLLSACVGSGAVALVVTPLDVAKVRMQAEGPGCGVSCVSLESCRIFFCSNGITEHAFHKGDPRWRHCFGARRGEGPSARSPGSARGLGGTLRRIAAEGGLAGLYAGLPATLLVGVPSNVLYFATYETLRDWLQAQPGQAALAAPCLAGGAARAVAVIACAPLEVVRTRVQAGALGGELWKAGGPIGNLRDIVEQEGASVVFRGLRSTLWRDVPFSAFYWFGVEAGRRRLVQQGWWEGRPVQGPLTSFIASFLAGATAAFCTTPFDVVKTRMQVATAAAVTGASALGMWGLMVRIWRQEGPSALWAGASPRLARVAPACGIMLGTYETAKSLLKTQ